MGSATYIGAKHLSFRKMSLTKGRKLNEYRVINRYFTEPIGVIRWRGGWRQYVFVAKPEIDMSRSCMKEIIKFINKLMKEWYDVRKK